ncbi:MAG: hypothetical protein NC401_15785 [Ruminococcus sp.]|nr:hypothetical protein [Ruminococcus sp.]
MKIFRELYFRGDSSDLNKFVADIGKFAKDDWRFVPQFDNDKTILYLFFDYSGKKVENARVSIYLGDRIKTGELDVGNIVPLNKNQLSVEEYNDVLMLFYKDIVAPFKEKNHYVEIPQPTDDIFDPLSVMSKDALNKLRNFCGMANKSTGSIHPCDRERWLDFIYQTVEDEKIIDSTTLCNFLQDKDYWHEKPNNFIGVVGSFAWDDEKAYELSIEYEMLSEAMQYYKDKRGR